MSSGYSDTHLLTSWCKKILTTVSAFLVLALGDVKAAPVQDPEIVTQNGQEVLLLPDSLEALIAQRFPGFRVPGLSDVKGLWARIRVAGMFPFVATADFNGDGLKDVALILLSDSAFKIVIFNKTANGYTVAYESGNELGPPLAGTPFYQRLLISVIEKGEDLQVDQSQFHAERDSVRVGIFEEEVSVMFWNGETYESLPLGSSL